MQAISLDTAILVTNISKRTLWRRVTEGQLRRLDTDERGRAMIAFDEIVPLLRVNIAPADYELLIDADAGDADAQNDLAQMFFDDGLSDMGLFWLKLAVDQQHPDAMHNLAMLYIKGINMPKDETTGLMWLAKAAANGHAIAKKQIAGLMPRGTKE